MTNWLAYANHDDRVIACCIAAERWVDARTVAMQRFGVGLDGLEVVDIERLERVRSVASITSPRLGIDTVVNLATVPILVVTWTGHDAGAVPQRRMVVTENYGLDDGEE